MKKKKSAAVSTPSSNGTERLMPFRWQPGQSGNPSGRSKDEYLLARLHREKLRELVPEQVMRDLAETVFGKQKSKERTAWIKRPLTWAQAIVLRNVYRALTADGDHVIRIVWEQIEGRPTIKLAGADGGPIQIERERDEHEELRNLSAEELRELIRIKRKAAGELLH